MLKGERFEAEKKEKPKNRKSTQQSVVWSRPTSPNCRFLPSLYPVESATFCWEILFQTLGDCLDNTSPFKVPIQTIW